MKVTERRQQGAGLSTASQQVHEHLWRVNWKSLGYPFCGVYAISPDNRWPTKIGISQNPVKRLINLQGAVWRRLDIAEYRYCQNQVEARQVEKKTHEILTEQGLMMNGEWFDIRPDKAMETVEFAAAVLGIEMRNDVPDERVASWLIETMNKISRDDYIKQGVHIEEWMRGEFS